MLEGAIRGSCSGELRSLEALEGGRAEGTKQDRHCSAEDDLVLRPYEQGDCVELLAWWSTPPSTLLPIDASDPSVSTLCMKRLTSEQQSWELLFPGNAFPPFWKYELNHTTSGLNRWCWLKGSG